MVGPNVKSRYLQFIVTQVSDLLSGVSSLVAAAMWATRSVAHIAAANMFMRLQSAVIVAFTFDCFGFIYVESIVNYLLLDSK